MPFAASRVGVKPVRLLGKQLRLGNSIECLSALMLSNAEGQSSLG